MALELVAVGVGTGLFFWLAPQTLVLYLVLAAVAVLLVAAGARHTRHHVWGPVEEPHGARLRSATLEVGLFTAVGAGLFLGVGLALHGRQILSGRLLLGTLAFYLPWALLQQTLFQFYLLGRLRVLAPAAPPLVLAAVCGLLYGSTHLPSGWLETALTVAGGTYWSYSYQRHRQLLPLAVSHAVLGSTLFCWMMHLNILPFPLGQLTP